MAQLNPVISNKLKALQGGLLKGHRIFTPELSDSDLERRFSEPSTYSHNVVMEFTKNEDLLGQYFRLRKDIYKKVLNCDVFEAQADEVDKRSEIIVLKSGNRCVGGARATISTPENPSLLPMEANGFYLKDAFPQIDFSKIAYAEVSRAAVLPEFAKGQYVDELYANLYYKGLEFGTEILFTITYALHARRARAAGSKIGLNMIQRPDIDAPHFTPSENLHLTLTMWDLTPDKRHEAALRGELVRKSDKEAAEEVAKADVEEFEFA